MNEEDAMWARVDDEIDRMKENNEPPFDQVTASPKNSIRHPVVLSEAEPA